MSGATHLAASGGRSSSAPSRRAGRRAARRGAGTPAAPPAVPAVGRGVGSAAANNSSSTRSRRAGVVWPTSISAAASRTVCRRPGAAASASSLSSATVSACQGAPVGARSGHPSVSTHQEPTVNPHRSASAAPRSTLTAAVTMAPASHARPATSVISRCGQCGRSAAWPSGVRARSAGVSTCSPPRTRQISLGRSCTGTHTVGGVPARRSPGKGASAAASVRSSGGGASRPESKLISRVSPLVGGARRRTGQLCRRRRSGPMGRSSRRTACACAVSARR